METQQNNNKSDVALREEEILKFWKENDIFNKTVETPAGKEPEGDFVFYDGPPFATGTPHYGHILAGTIKDAIPRFWTMNGKRVVRKWGWDCHGLPLENIIEKRLGLATKRDIEAMGVKQFNEAAREAVMEYADDWKVVVPRMGRFVDMETDYRTMDPTYTESVWWVFSELNKKGLVYEGFKSMHLCPRCGTTLSNFEVNQGYKDIKDIAVTVKLPLLNDDGKETDTSLLVWTTTPWTLPGNMAAAVHEDIKYAKVQVVTEGEKENYILAKERLEQLATDEYTVLEEIKGKDLVGKRYTPPFTTFTEQEFPNKENAWKIYHAEYVELGEEGTGAVHLAPAYGEEDMTLAKENNIPILHHVDESGRFKEFVAHFSGQLVKPKDDEKAEVSHLDSDIEIVKRLKEDGALFRKENIKHSYPHCWRCDTPLLNYGTTSWFVRVTDLKDDLVKENNKIKWVPAHVGKNRFGKWLEGARDWAISRQRYWGAPLPIWRKENSDEYTVIGSREELMKHVPTSGNSYFMMRHGEADHNIDRLMSSLVENEHHLTNKGKEEVLSAVEDLKKKNINLIVASPMHRAQETAELVAKTLGLEKEDILTDERLVDNKGGVFENKSIDDWYEYRNALTVNEKLTDRYEGGESWQDIKKRMTEVLFELEGEHKKKNVLIVSHGMPMQLMKWNAEGISHIEMVRRWDEEEHFGTAEIAEIDFSPFPHNDNYEFDLHRPYIDEVELFDENGTKMTRIPDVFDCWFESGSMPYGQHHYPFENTDVFNPEKKIGYPAQFIAEGLDQTRGWFYSLLVLGTALFKKSPFEKVVVNGLVLAEDGKKMAKSLQNYPDPMELADRVGADALRYYLLSSPIVKAEDLSLAEKDVLDIQRKNIGRLHNVLAMYEMYADESVAASDSSDNVLDKWMISRLNETTSLITTGYKNYELDKATRPLIDLIDDLSVWYLRRSRDRLKGVNVDDKKLCLGTLRHTLRTLSLLMAPVMPFYAEYLFQKVKEKDEAESVHLMPWSKAEKVNEEIIESMKKTREIVSLALEIRSKEGIKVRQPLAKLYLAKDTKMEEEHMLIVKDEVNVKEVSLEGKSASVEYDLIITPELKREGNVRELIRAIQDTRKEKGLNPQDSISLLVDYKMADLISGFEEIIKGVVGAELIMRPNKITRPYIFEKELIIDGEKYEFSVKDSS